MAIDKTLVQAIGRARATGMSWRSIGRVLGAPEDAQNKQQLIDVLTDNRREALQHLLRDVT